MCGTFVEIFDHYDYCEVGGMKHKTRYEHDFRARSTFIQ